jgi:hypothetical protein
MRKTRRLAANSLQKQPERVGGRRATAERRKAHGISGRAREAIQPWREIHLIPT